MFGSEKIGSLFSAIQSQVIFCLFLSLGLNDVVFAQKHSLKIGTDFPLQYAVGYDYQISPKFSAGTKLGVLTTPYDEIILGLFRLFGGNDKIIDVISNGYELGGILELGGNYYFKNHYISLNGQYINLQSSQARVDLIETLIGRELDKLPPFINPEVKDDVIELKSSLLQAAIRYGWIKQLKNPKLQLRTEVSLSLNLTSNTKLRSDEYDISNANVLIDKIFTEFYHHYAYLPTFNIYLVYFLGRKK